MKANWIEIKKVIIYLFEKNREYRIKLLLMLIFIFSTFIGTLIYIIHTKSINGIDPVILDINTNTVLGRIVTSNIFKRCTHFCFNIFNLGPSYETLLGLIVITFFILIFLIIAASYLKLILIPLMLLTSVIFYNWYKILQNQYNVENTVEIFNKFGISLKKNTELPKIISEDELLGNIELLIILFNDRAKLVNKTCDWSDLNKDELLYNLIEKNYTNWGDVNLFISTYFKENIIISDINWITWIYNTSEYIVVQLITSLNHLGVFIINNPGNLIIFVITIGGLMYLYTITKTIQNEVKEVAHVQDKQIDVVNAIDHKINKVDDTLTTIGENLKKTNIASEELTKNITQINSSVSKTNDQVGFLAEGLEKQGKGTLEAIEKLVGVKDFNGEIPISLSELLVNQGLINDRLTNLLQQVNKIDEIIKNWKK